MSITKQSEDLLRQFHESQPKPPRRGMTAVELEREECARIAEAMDDHGIAEAIRQRGERRGT